VTFCWKLERMNSSEIMENNSEIMENSSNNLEKKSVKLCELEALEDVELCLMKSTLRTKKRRRRREAYRPYYQLSERERNLREEKERMRIVKLRERMRAKGRILAPYNTTQFLMADHPEDTLELSELLENEQNFDFYSSQSDEDFMSKEFNKDYDIQHVTHLEKMSKEMLLKEYMRLERKNDALEGRLEDFKDNDEQTGKTKENLDNGETNLEEDAMEKSIIFQKEMEYLMMDNRRLSNENDGMRKRLKLNSETSSSSDSSSSSSSSSSDSSDEECNDDKPTYF